MRIRIDKEELDELIQHLDYGQHPRCKWNEQDLINRLARDLKDARWTIAEEWINEVVIREPHA